MLCYFNNCNILQLSRKATSNEEIENFIQVLPDSISENLSVLVQTDKCGAINKTDTTIMGCDVIKFISEPYKQQEQIM